MKDSNIKGEVRINPTSGEVKVISKERRLAFPVEVVEAGTERGQRVSSYPELVRVIRNARQHVLRRRDPKSDVIKEKINVHMRTVHEHA